MDEMRKIVIGKRILMEKYSVTFMGIVDTAGVRFTVIYRFRYQ